MSTALELSKDFPRLVRTLFLEKKIDYWDFMTKVYENSQKSKTEYFKNVIWAHLDRPRPICPDLENDFRIIKGIYAIESGETRTGYKIDEDSLLRGPLGKYATDESIPPLL